MYVYEQKIEVDLNEPPIPEEIHEGDEFAQGDLHGNTPYLLWFLGKKSAVVYTDEVYKKVKALYERHRETMSLLRQSNSEENIERARQDIIEFVELLDQIDINDEAVVKNVLYDLIGDDFAERGSGDIFVLLIYAKLHDHNIDFTINISNHGLYFLKAFYQGLYGEGMGGDFSISMLNLGILIENGIVMKEQVEQMYRTVVLPRLIAVNYRVISQNPPKMALLFHAPNPVRILMDLPNYLGQTFDENDIPGTIERVNQEFWDMINYPHRINQAFPDRTTTSYDSAMPFDGLIWNRMDDGTDITNIQRPPKKWGWEFIYVHGHDGKGRVPTHKAEYVVNLDGMVGMPPYFDPKTGLLLTFDRGTITFLTFSKEFPKLLPNQTLNILATPEPGVEVKDERTTTLELASLYLNALPAQQGVDIFIDGDQATVTRKGLNTLTNITIGPNAKDFAAINNFIASLTNKRVNLLIDNENYTAIKVLPDQIESLALLERCKLETESFEKFTKQFVGLDSLTLARTKFTATSNPSTLMESIGRLSLPTHASLKKLDIGMTFSFVAEDLPLFIEQISNPDSNLASLDFSNEPVLFENDIKALTSLIKTNSNIKTLTIGPLNDNMVTFVRGIIESYNSNITECIIGGNLLKFPRNEDVNLGIRISILLGKWKLFDLMLTEFSKNLVQSGNDHKKIPQILLESENYKKLGFDQNVLKSHFNDIFIYLFQKFQELKLATDAVSAEIAKGQHPQFVFESQNNATSVLERFYIRFRLSLQDTPIEEYYIGDAESAKKALVPFASFTRTLNANSSLATMIYKRFLAFLLNPNRDFSNEPSKLEMFFEALEDPSEEFKVAFLNRKVAAKEILTDEQAINVAFLEKFLKKYIDLMLLKNQDHFKLIIDHLTRLEKVLPTLPQKQALIKTVTEYYTHKKSSSEKPVAQKQETVPQDETATKLHALNQIINSEEFKNFVIKYHGSFDFEKAVAHFPAMSAYLEDTNSKILFYYQFVVSWTLLYKHLRESTPQVETATMNNFVSLSYDRAIHTFKNLPEKLKTREFSDTFTKMLATMSSHLTSQKDFWTARLKIDMAHDQSALSSKDKLIILSNINKEHVESLKGEVATLAREFTSGEKQRITLEKVSKADSLENLSDLIDTLKREHGPLLSIIFFNSQALNKATQLQERIKEAITETASMLRKDQPGPK